ncbi:hemerythrin family protein [Candidatus Thiothrix sp. Deng01]|uniref:Hemerythrin family protein n=1 Tax=Candidatus Thiothrix phosphatis TaxID=3112415 RepID=A0ABU6CYV5_9GAMM|nr:hemerythrin family protein [Candidatus Thiothrix sp. Deng01]MEB4591563.1 hemerythrin family protein [Candidatus Thiothrix sp. Deng01]
MHPAFSLMGSDEAPEALIDYPRFGIAYMEQNYNCFAILYHDLDQLLTEPKPNFECINVVLGDLAEHLSKQFSQEERAMKLAAYPDLLQHRHQHQRALEQLAWYIGRWKTRRNIWEIHDFIKQPLLTWFLNHAHTSDKAAALFTLGQKGWAA